MAIFKRRPTPRSVIQDNVFTQILRKAVDEGIIPERTARARTWMRDQAKRFTGQINDQQLMNSDPTRFRAQVVPGRVYMFFYDPKLRKTLPYYDTFPIIIPLVVYHNSFLGLNLHYLPPNYRAALMDKLYLLLNNKNFDETTKIQVTYKLLRNVSQLKYFRPCIKKYLRTNVRSRFVSIGAEEWSIALFLPLQRFEKQPDTRVWMDSVNKINFGKGSYQYTIKTTSHRAIPTTR